MGDKTLWTNYSGISLQSTPGKAYGMTVTERIVKRTEM